MVQLELELHCVRKNQSRVIRWEDAALALQHREHFITERELSVRVGLPRSTLQRVLEGLKRKRVIRILKKSSGAGGGIILRVSEPDDISELLTRRIERLGQMRDRISSRDNWENDPNLLDQWANLGHSLGQLKALLSSQIQMELFDQKKNTGPIYGPVEVLRHKTVFRESEEKAKSAVKGGDDASQGEWTPISAEARALLKSAGFQVPDSESNSLENEGSSTNESL